MEPGQAQNGTWGQTLARAVPLGRPSDDQLAAIRTHLVDADVLEDHAPFVFRATVSNSNLDAYFTRMATSSLRNYAEDAQRGIALLTSHDTRSLPMGRSFEAQYVGAGGNGVERVDETFYTLRGLNLGGLDTDRFIDGLRAGIARDVSIGFYGGRYLCSICGADWMRTMDCPHWPGMEYPVLKNGKPTDQMQTCFLWVEDARQAEASVVYDGATPGCMVLKARQMDAAGLLKPDTAAVLEQRYRIRLPGAQPKWAGHREAPQEAAMPEETAPAPEAETQEETPTEPTAEPQPAAPAEPDGGRAVIAAARQALVDAGQPADTELVAGIRQLTQENVRLRPLADDGRAYRADLIAEAMAEGVRAQGEGFAAETYRTLLETAPLATIKRFRDDWKALGDKVFPGGRQTKDAHEPSDEAKARAALAQRTNGAVTIPDAAYRAR